jgi:hypothetical protein
MLPKAQVGKQTAKKVNIDGKIYSTDSQEYIDMYDEGLIGTMKGDTFYGNKSNLQPVTIYSSYDKDKQKFNKRLQEEASEADYESIMKLDAKYGSPKVVMIPTKDGEFHRPYYNPFTETIYIGSYADNPYPLMDDYIAELSHHKQFKEKSPWLRGLKDFGSMFYNMLKHGESSVEAYERLYNTPGTVEHQAHEEIEPELEEERNKLYWQQRELEDYYEYPGTFQEYNPKLNKKLTKGGWLDKYQDAGTYPKLNFVQEPLATDAFNGRNPSSDIRLRAMMQDKIDQSKEAARPIPKQTFISQGRPNTPEQDKLRYQFNKKYAQDNDLKFNYKTAEVASKHDKTAKGKDWGMVSVPALVQSAAMTTPSGQNYDAGAIGAETFVNTNPLGTGQFLSTGRLYQAGKSLADSKTKNPYINEDNNLFENVLGAAGFLGDIAMLRMGIQKPWGNFNPRMNHPAKLNITASPVDQAIALAQYGKQPILTNLDFHTSQELFNANLFNETFQQTLKRLRNEGNSWLGINKVMDDTYAQLRKNPDFDFNVYEGLLDKMKKRGHLTYLPGTRDFRQTFIQSDYPLGSQAKKTLRNPLGMIDENWGIGDQIINVRGDKMPGYDRFASEKAKMYIPQYERLIKLYKEGKLEDPSLLKDIEQRLTNLYQDIPAIEVHPLTGEPTGNLFTGKEAFRKLRPNKYGGATNTSLPKMQWAGSSQPQNQSLNWLDTLPSRDERLSPNNITSIVDQNAYQKTLVRDKIVGEKRTPVKYVDLQNRIYPDNFKRKRKYIVDKSCSDLEGLGCSWQATTEAMKLTGLPKESYAPANAGYRDAVAERTGLQRIFDQEGEQRKNAESRSAGWKYPTENDFSTWRIGDIVVLDHGHYDEKYNYGPPPGYTEADRTNATHNGVIVGFTKSGRPVIRHGGASGKHAGFQYTEVLGKDNRVSDLRHGRYAIKSVWRPKEINADGLIEKVEYVKDKGADRAKRIAETEFDVKFDLAQTKEEGIIKELPVAAAFAGVDQRLKTKKQLVNLFNDKALDKEIQYKLGIDALTLQNLKPVVYGIAGQEYNYNNLGYAASAKEAVAEALAKVGRENSKGLFQVNYESLTEDERDVLDIKKPDDLFDTNKAYKAAIFLLYQGKQIMDREVDKGTHPELENLNPYFRAAYYYNSPARAVNTAEEWINSEAETKLENPSTWLNWLPGKQTTKKFVGNYDPKKYELRMDAGSYPDKLMEYAQQDLIMKKPEGSESSLEEVRMYGQRTVPPKNVKFIDYNKK